jgi:hypothetical protein
MYQLLKQDLTEVDIVIPEDFEQKEINAIATYNCCFEKSLTKPNASNCCLI